MKKSIWKQILQIIITVATSIVSALGVTSCMGHIFTAGSNERVERVLVEGGICAAQHSVYRCALQCYPCEYSLHGGAVAPMPSETWLQMYRVSFFCDEGWRAASHPPNE